MEKIILYIKEAYNELVHKVTWPSWEDLQSSAIVVLIASLIIAFLVLAMDRSANFVLEKLYEMIIQ